MSRLHREIERMWWSSKEPPLILRAASHLYAAVNRLNLNKRTDRSEAPPLPLISVGNLTVGGSGKTPFVIWLAGELRAAGFSPVILCRGDGGNSDTPQLLNSDSDPLIVGDEALLLYRKSGCPVIAGRDRCRGARMAGEHGDIIILDDGFQYRQLQRTCDIVLIPAEGIGNGFLIPAGPLREPPESLARADLIVRTGMAEATQPLGGRREWSWRAVEGGLLQLNGRKEAPHKAVAITAIARPERFLASLEKLGIEVAATHIFPDHHRFSSADIAPVLDSGLPGVCTAKDAVKLTAIWPDSTPLWVLEQRPEAEEGLFEAILESISHAAEEKSHADA